MVTAKHSTSGANSGAECNGIVSWIEVQKKIYLRKKKKLDISMIIDKYSNKIKISPRKSWFG